MNKITKYAVVAALTASLASCNIYKKYETPTTSAVTAAYVESKASEPQAAMPSYTPWQEIYTDPVLADLIERACTANTNLRNAHLNVEAAQAQLQGARLSYLPSLAVAPAYNGSKVGSGSDFTWSYQLPAQVSWEVDVFGKLLTSNRRAKAALEQSEAYMQAVRSQIIASVASTYYSLAAVRAQLALSRSTSELWLETVNKMRDLKLAGRTTEAGVMQSEANYYSILASITDLETSEHKLNNTLSLLLGTMPQRWEVNENIAAVTPPALAADGAVPMALLGARPDVEASEKALAMAYYNTAAARQAFYPNLNITANGGFTNLLGTVVTNPAQFFLQLSGQLAAPIFSRGRNIANLKASKAAQQQAFNNFEYSLLSAAAEVSDALTVYKQSTAKAALLDRQVDDLAKAVSMTQDLFTYSNGDVNYLNVITAQQGLLQAQVSRIAANLAANLAVVNLYQAIGAGR